MWQTLKNGSHEYKVVERMYFKYDIQGQRIQCGCIGSVARTGVASSSKVLLLYALYI